MESEETSPEQSEPPDSSTSYDWLSRFYDTISAPGGETFHPGWSGIISPARNETVLEIGFGTDALWCHWYARWEITVACMG